MNYNFSNNQPIYLQIVRQLEREIISGARSPGDRVESVRELAIKIKVNPNYDIDESKTNKISFRFFTEPKSHTIGVFAGE